MADAVMDTLTANPRAVRVSGAEWTYDPSVLFCG